MRLDSTSVVRSGSLSKLFGATFLALLFDAATLGVPARSCGPAGLVGDECGSHATGEAFFCNVAVAQL